MVSLTAEKDDLVWQQQIILSLTKTHEKLTTSSTPSKS